MDDVDLENMWFQQFIGNQVWRMCYLTKWFSRLAATIVRFDAVRLFAVRLITFVALLLKAPLLDIDFSKILTEKDLFMLRPNEVLINFSLSRLKYFKGRD